MRPSLFTLQIPDAEFVVCDVETTGLSPEHNRITEIALVRVADGRITDRWSSLVNPRQFIPPAITELTGISNEMVYAAPGAEELLPAIRRFIGEAVFVGHNVQFDRRFVDCTLRRAGAEPLTVPQLCTARLARRLTPSLARKNLASIARHLGITNPRAHRAAGDAETTAKVLLHFFDVLQEEFDVSDVGGVLSFQHKPVFRVTTPPANFPKLKDTLELLPHAPGVYFFHDRRGHVIYVGKARDLHERVSSYFRHNVGHSDKVRKLARAVHGLTWRQTETELSALLAESRAIKQHQPRFNTMLKSLRMYPFIRIDMTDAFPTIGWSYEIEEDGAEYFGPFSSRFAVEQALETIDRLFLLRECDGPIRPDPATVPCLYYAIKRCSAPCAAMLSETDYREEVRSVALFLRGMHDGVLEGLRQRMMRRAEAMDFEAAAVIRDRLLSLERIVRQQRVMTRPIHEQNLVIVTLARRTTVEVHLIRSGMLARQITVDQKTVARAALRAAVEEVFFSSQGQLFQGRQEDINEMRIIASWCLTRRDESTVIEVDDVPTVAALLTRMVAAIRDAGKPAEEADGDGASMAAAGAG